MSADRPEQIKSPKADRLDDLLQSSRLHGEMLYVDKRAYPIDKSLPKDFTNGGKSDLTIVDDTIARVMAEAKAKMTPEQIARVEREAASPYRAIANAARIDAQREAQGKHEVTAKPGDSYWSVAHGVVSERKGRQATGHEVKGMVSEMASYNGKTEAEAAHLKVGEKIKIPPHKTAS